jgi:hypothetical protein
MAKSPTFIVDLNEVRADNRIVLSLFHTLEHGPRVLVEQDGVALDSGDYVLVYNDDDDKFFEARIEKRLSAYEYDAVMYMTSGWQTSTSSNDGSADRYSTSNQSGTLATTSVVS